MINNKKTLKNILYSLLAISLILLFYTVIYHSPSISTAKQDSSSAANINSSSTDINKDIRYTILDKRKEEEKIVLLPNGNKGFTPIKKHAKYYAIVKNKETDRIIEYQIYETVYNNYNIGDELRFDQIGCPL